MAYLLVHHHSLWIAGTSYFSFANQFFSTDQVSPQTFIAIHDIHVLLDLMKKHVCPCMSTLRKFDTQCKGLLCFTEYISRNIFAQGIARICQIFFRQCLYTVNSPNFLTAKVSLHMVVWCWKILKGIFSGIHGMPLTRMRRKNHTLPCNGVVTKFSLLAPNC